ncbi:MAG: hypothetical protein Q9228_005547 [Teloschistes exilis]
MLVRTLHHILEDTKITYQFPCYPRSFLIPRFSNPPPKKYEPLPRRLDECPTLEKAHTAHPEDMDNPAQTISPSPPETSLQIENLEISREIPLRRIRNHIFCLWFSFGFCCFILRSALASCSDTGVEIHLPFPIVFKVPPSPIKVLLSPVIVLLCPILVKVLPTSPIRLVRTRSFHPRTQERLFCGSCRGLRDIGFPFARL